MSFFVLLVFPLCPIYAQESEDQFPSLRERMREQDNAIGDNYTITRKTRPYEIGDPMNREQKPMTSRDILRHQLEPAYTRENVKIRPSGLSETLENQLENQGGRW